MATSTQTYDIDVTDVEYLQHGDTPLLARLFKPQGSRPFPIMIELHGGAWVRGNRLNGDTANEALAKTGVSRMNITWKSNCLSWINNYPGVCGRTLATRKFLTTG